MLWFDRAEAGRAGSSQAGQCLEMLLQRCCQCACGQLSGKSFIANFKPTQITCVREFQKLCCLVRIVSVTLWVSLPGTGTALAAPVTATASSDGHQALAVFCGYP